MKLSPSSVSILTTIIYFLQYKYNNIPSVKIQNSENGPAEIYFMTNESKYSLEHLEKALFRTLSPGFKIEDLTEGQNFNYNNSADLSWA